MAHLDPRLANVELLMLAALRVREKPPQRIELQVVYNGVDGEPPTLGLRIVYELRAGRWCAAEEASDAH